jgi:hypothetical protein
LVHHIHCGSGLLLCGLQIRKAQASVHQLKAHMSTSPTLPPLPELDAIASTVMRIVGLQKGAARHVAEITLEYMAQDRAALASTAAVQAALSSQAPAALYETDIYDFAGWLTIRPGVMPVGSTSEAGPMAEAVGEYIKTYPERFAALSSQAPADERDVALSKIADWNSHTTQMSVDYGSNGVRDFYRQIARAALSAPAQPASGEAVAYRETITGRLCEPDDEHRRKFPMCYRPLSYADTTPPASQEQADPWKTEAMGKMSRIEESMTLLADKLEQASQEQALPTMRMQRDIRAQRRRRAG